MENNDFWGIHKHHIVFRSQGGLDFDLNMIELTQEEHEGNHGPHQSRARDLELKRGLQEQLSELFPEGELIRSAGNSDAPEDILRSILKKCQTWRGCTPALKLSKG